MEKYDPGRRRFCWWIFKGPIIKHSYCHLRTFCFPTLRELHLSLQQLHQYGPFIRLYQQSGLLDRHYDRSNSHWSVILQAQHSLTPHSQENTSKTRQFHSHGHVSSSALAVFFSKRSFISKDFGSCKVLPIAKLSRNGRLLLSEQLKQTEISTFEKAFFRCSFPVEGFGRSASKQRQSAESGIKEEHNLFS